jgi:hypothetical protein
MKTAAEWARELDGIAFSEDIEKIQQDARAELVEALRDLLADVELARDGDTILDGNLTPAHLYAARAALKETT